MTSSPIPTPAALDRRASGNPGQAPGPRVVPAPLDDPDVEVVQEWLRPADDVEDVLALVGDPGPAGPPPLVTVNLASCDTELQRRALAKLLTWPGAHLMDPSQSTVAVRFSGGRRPQLTVVFSVKAVCRQRLTTVPSQVWVVDPALMSKGLKP